MELGSMVNFQKHIVKQTGYYPKISEETKEFIESKKKKWNTNYTPKTRIETLDQPKQGIVCGTRVIDLTGDTDCDGFYSAGIKCKIYLVATGMNMFYRVPEEFIEVIR